MSCRSEPSNPNSRHGDGTRCDHTTAECPQDCPRVEFEINDTSTANDDLVLVKCERPNKRHKINCRIRSTSSGNTHSVVLTNPDGRLRFPNSGDTTKSLTVRDDGQWVSFEISGERGSDAMNDAVIEARCMSDSGPVIGTKTVTVVHFDQAKMDIATPGSYSFTTNRLTTTGGHAVTYEMEARIRPSGVDCSAPQITNLRIGLLQNLENTTRTITWDSPSITWIPGTATGTAAMVPTQIVRTISVSTQTNDSEATVAPLYDQPGKGATLNSNSLKQPMGCAGAATATTHDTPATTVPATFSIEARDAGGAIVGRVNFSAVGASINDRFTSWCVVFDTSTNELCTLRERPWTVNVSSGAAGTQKASPQADRTPTIMPTTTPPFINDVAKLPANQTLTTSGSRTFTAP